MSNYTISVIRLLVDTAETAVYPKRVVGLTTSVQKNTTDGDSIGVRYVFDLRSEPAAEVFTPFEELTEEQVQGWLQSPTLEAQRAEAFQAIEQLEQQVSDQSKIGDLAPPWEETTITLTSTPNDLAVASAATGDSSVSHTLEGVQRDKISQVSKWCYDKETGGIFVEEINVKTDRESQLQLFSYYTALKNGSLNTVIWQASPYHWVPLTLEQVETIFTSVIEHIQDCRRTEQYLIEKINSCATIDEVLAVELL